MDSHLLRIFVAVAETGTVSSAAKRLNYVQSNVTARIHQLEEELGSQLFHRKPRGVILTKTGERLLNHAKSIIKQIDTAENDIRFMESGAGNLRIASTESNSAIRLSNVLSKLHQTYPKMNIELFTGHTEYVTEMVLNHQADLGYISGYPTHPELDVIKEISEDILMVEPVSQPVPNVIIAFKKGCTYRKILEEWMSFSKHYEYRIMEFGSLETIIGCVAAGMGRTILPEKVILKMASTAITTSTLPKKFGKTPTCLIKRKDLNENQYRPFLEILTPSI